jgi:PKD domain
VKRLVLVAALCGVGMLVPAMASAAVKQIVVNENVSTYCITVDNGPSAVTFTARAPGGGALFTKQITTAVAGTNCTGVVTAGVESFSVNVNNYQGASMTADAGGGVSTTFPIPFGSYDAMSGTGIVKLANLPATAGVATISGGAPIGYTGPTYTTPSAVSVGSAAIDITSTLGGIPYRAMFSARQFSISASYYGTVGVSGVDPLGSPVTVTVSAGGAVQQSLSVTPGADDGQSEQARLARAIPSGAVVTVTQPGWFSHTVTLGTLSARANGVDVSIPAVAGETGSASLNLSFQATSGLPSSNPLSCLSFGDATYMLSQCGAASARYAATFPLFFSANDSVYIDVDEPDGDSASTRVSGSGLIGSVSDGQISAYGLAPYAPLLLTATTPAGATVSTPGSTYSDGSAYFGGEGSNYVKARLVSGTSLSANGSATGGAPRTLLLNLVAHASGTVISGTTYPGGHVAIHINRPVGSTPTVYGSADGDGAFALDIGALLPRDSVQVEASDPTGTMISEQTLVPGSPQPVIQGLVDQQLVHGILAITALGGGPAGMTWGGDGPNALADAAPYTYTLDTTVLSDGPHLVNAYPAGLYYTMGDYVWVRVDNTAPSVTAASDQYVGIGYSTALLASAYDANGLASVVATFGDGTTLTQPVATLGQPIRHTYAKVGTYTATVTVTDAAGNTTTDTTAIHVLGTLSSQLTGKIPASFKQAALKKKRKNLTVKLTAHTPGDLHVRVLTASGKLRASVTLTFATANKKATLTIPTRKLPKGRYTVVLQFTDASGTPGPVVVQPLRIR